MTVFFTSDQHLGHRNIIKYQNRPFKDVSHMTEGVITNWNSMVRPEDHIYVLGDFSFIENSQQNDNILSRLNGKKYLVRGNHDAKESMISSHWIWVKDYHELVLNDIACVMMHYPIESWRRYRRGSIHLHGHTHGSGGHHNITAKKGRIDVGVDCWKYYPVSLDHIRKLDL